MRNVILAVVVVLFLCASGCVSTAWVWDDNDAIGARVGGYLTENNEAGGSIKMRDEDSEIREVGIYAIHHFPDLVEFRNPFMVDFLPDTITGSAYLGGKIDYDLDTHNSKTDPIAGVIFEDTLFIEHSLDGNSFLGLRFKY